MAFSILIVLNSLYAEDDAETQECEALFVQNADSVTIDDKKFTMKGIGRTVIYFCDRPVRLAGHLSLDEFLESWTKGKDTFTNDPPNAVLSVIDGNEIYDVVVTLTAQPKLEGDDLTYTYRIIDGDIPSAGEAASLFIDVIGRPATPTSRAGVHRRHARRHARHAVRRCAAGVTCY